MRVRRQRPRASVQKSHRWLLARMKLKGLFLEVRGPTWFRHQVLSAAGALHLSPKGKTRLRRKQRKIARRRRNLIENEHLAWSRD